MTLFGMSEKASGKGKIWAVGNGGCVGAVVIERGWVEVKLKMGDGIDSNRR